MNMKMLFNTIADIACAAGKPIEPEYKTRLINRLREALQPSNQSKDLTELEAHRSIIRDLVRLLSHTEHNCSCDNCRLLRVTYFGQAGTTTIENFKFQNLIK